MAVKTKFRMDGTILVMTSSGVCNGAQELISHNRSIAMKLISFIFKRMINDIRDVEFNVDAIDLYELIKTFDKDLPDNSRTVWNALLHDKKHAKLAEAWETMTYNQGFKTKVFTEMEDAKKWLSEGK